MGIKVLSLFDGISCGQVALRKTGIEVDEYYASEIDEYAMSITKYNFPNTVQLGNVQELTHQDIENLPSIDLLIGGSPCQNLSSSNSSDRSGLRGEKSSLFFEYVRVLDILKLKNPNVKFLFENVGSASIEDREIIDGYLGVNSVKFNSELVSAQYRNRLYWSNFSFDVPKERKNIFMNNILEESVDDKYYLSQKMYNYIMSKGTKGWQSGKLEINLEISRPLTATMHKMHRADTDNYVSTSYQPMNKTNVRKLTPVECERLQTLPDNYTELGIKLNGETVKISDTRRYISIGNGWTVDVIAYILKRLKRK